MGSLGDKFKKLAGDQTRQLLQNFQNAQSSKTRNGYSYGKLNEDGTATLADGTVVQTVVKGRPGQYAPVFNLGNGQGLVDQPEAKFFTVDSGSHFSYIVMVSYFTQLGPAYSISSPAYQTITINDIFIVDKSGDKYHLPSQFWPFIERTMGSGDTYPDIQVTVSTGFGGFTVLVHEAGQSIGLRSFGVVEPPTLSAATLLVIHSFSLRTLEDGTKIVSVRDDDYELRTIDFNPVIPSPALEFSTSRPQIGAIEGSGLPCYFGGNHEEYVGNSLFTILNSELDTQLKAKVLIRGKKDSKLVFDFSIYGASRYYAILTNYYDNITHTSTEFGPPGFQNIVLAYTLTPNGPYGPTDYIYNRGGPQTGDVIVTGSENSLETNPFDVRDPLNGCGSKFLQGASQSQEGLVTYSKVVSDDTLLTKFSDEVRSPTLGNENKVNKVLAVYPSTDPESFYSLSSYFNLFFPSPEDNVSFRQGYNNVRYSEYIDKTTYVQGSFRYPATNFPISEIYGIPVLFGSGGIVDASIFGGLTIHERVDIGIDGEIYLTDFQDQYTVFPLSTASLNLAVITQQDTESATWTVYTLPSIKDLVGEGLKVSIDYGFK